MKSVRLSIVGMSAMLVACLSATVCAQTNVTFPDPNLEVAVRYALVKPTGNLTSTDVETLTSLIACNRSITNLSGLEWAANLTGLYLEGNSISDLTPLARLSNLTDLNLGDNRVTDGSVLLGLTNLAGLWLYGNPIRGVTVLTNLSGLTSLILYNCGLTDLTPLAGLTRLSYLEIRSNPLTNFSPALAGLTNLTTLYLGDTSISDVSFLQNLTRLSFLNLDHNNVGDLSPLTALSNLMTLDLSYNPLTNLAQVSVLTNLTNLYLSGDSISNLTVLQTLGQLTSLTLYSNRVSDLSPLAGLTNLGDLGLSWNPVTNYGALVGFTNLTSLWLDGNSISNLSFVQGLTRLSALGLRYDQLDDLGVLSGLTNLMAVHADFNRLTNITALQNLPYLSWAGLVGNLLDLSPGSSAMTAIENLRSRGAKVFYLPQNRPPSLQVATNWIIATNAASTLGFYVSDDLTPSDRLLVNASSANTNLIPNESISFAGSYYNRTLTVTPEPDQTGTSAITVTVTDDAGLSANVTVLVTVVVPQPVVIRDPNLDAVIRAMLHKDTGSLTSLDLQSLTYLSVFEAGVSDLSGLEWATNLSTLNLVGNFIRDLTVLQSLSRLTTLSINANSTADLSSLAGLTNLRDLFLDENSVSNLTFLQNLVGLNTLSLNDNRITDLWPLAGLTNLSVLYLQQNRLTNIVAMQSLPQLSYVDISLNLLDFDTGTSATVVVEGLQDRGADVTYLPQREPPVIEARTNWVIAVNGTSSLSFNVTDNGPSSEQLIVTATSSNSELVPNANVILTQDINSDWILILTPAAEQTGTTTITLTVTNDVGLSTIGTVQVTVVVPQPLDGGLLNNTNLTWTTLGNAPWFGQSSVTHDGDSAAQSGAIGDAEESRLETILVGPGNLTFWWKVSSEENWDWLGFYINGVLQTNRISGEVDWQQQVVTLPLGTQTLTWQYSKDEGASAGLDAGWLDQVTFVPLSWLELAGPPTNGQCQLILHPVPDKLYEVLASTNLQDWFRLAVLVATNNTMLYLDMTANSDARFYRLNELPASSIWLQNPNLVEGAIQLVLNSPPGLRFEMQVSTNLTSWSALALITNVLGTVQYTDLLMTNSPVRFYRARVIP